MVPPGPIVPAHYAHLLPAVQGLNRKVPFEQAVLVMMKFPDDEMTSSQKRCLRELFALIKQRLSEQGLHALRADGRMYAPSRQLVENVDVYMLASKRGIAVLDFMVSKGMNPNVTHEHGVMKALGRDVALFRQKGLELRADFVGTHVYDFVIREEVLDRESVQQALDGWLIDIGLEPRSGRETH